MAANQHEMIWISQLIAEKDRLIHEKDELVASKDRMWRKLHHIIKEKDARIAELCAGRGPKIEDAESNTKLESLGEENRRLQERVDELEEALQQTLEDDANEEDGGDEHEEAGYGEAGDMMQTALNTERIGVNRRTPARLTPNPTPNSTRSGQIDCFSVETLPTAYFYVQPLIESIDNEPPAFGQLSELAPSLLQTLQATLDSMQQSPRLYNASKIGSRHCAWQHIKESTSGWTVSRPRSFCCRTCFNKRRACLAPVGDGKWHLLPVPPEVRSPSATWKDHAYYIFDGTGTNMSFGGVWEQDKSKQKRSLERAQKRQKLDADVEAAEEMQSLALQSSTDGQQDEDEPNLRQLLNS